MALLYLNCFWLHLKDLHKVEEAQGWTLHLTYPSEVAGNPDTLWIMYGLHVKFLGCWHSISTVDLAFSLTQYKEVFVYFLLRTPDVLGQSLYRSLGVVINGM